MLRLLSRFLRALFQFSKRAAGKATKFGRSGVKLLGVVSAARLECGEPAAESGELIRRQLGNSFGNFFDFHGNMVLKCTAPEGSKVSALARTSHLLAISFPNYLAARLSDLIGRRHRVVVEVHVAVGFGPQTNTPSDGV